MAQYVVFQLSNQQYAVSIKDVSSIEVIQPITYVPGSHPVVRGLINLRGTLTPIIDMHCYFQTGVQADESQAKIIVLFDGEETVGLLVDDARDVMEFNEQQIEPVSDVFLENHVAYFEGVANFPDRTIAILNTQRVLDITAKSAGPSEFTSGNPDTVRTYHSGSTSPH